MHHLRHCPFYQREITSVEFWKTRIILSPNEKKSLGKGQKKCQYTHIIIRITATFHSNSWISCNYIVSTERRQIILFHFPFLFRSPFTSYWSHLFRFINYNGCNHIQMAHASIFSDRSRILAS